MSGNWVTALCLAKLIAGSMYFCYQKVSCGVGVGLGSTVTYYLSRPKKPAKSVAELRNIISELEKEKSDHMGEISEVEEQLQRPENQTETEQTFLTRKLNRLQKSREECVKFLERAERELIDMKSQERRQRVNKVMN